MSGILWAAVGTTFGAEESPMPASPAFERAPEIASSPSRGISADDLDLLAPPVPKRGMIFPVGDLPVILRLENHPVEPLTLRLPVRDETAPFEPAPVGRSV